MLEKQDGFVVRTTVDERRRPEEAVMYEEEAKPLCHDHHEEDIDLDSDLESAAGGHNDTMSSPRRWIAAHVSSRIFKLDTVLFALCTLLPSPIAALLGHPTAPAPQRNATSYLNGVRGVAALVVVIFHTSNTFSVAALRGWGDPPNHYLLQLPLLRLATSGSFMVHVFYVLSGFSLAYGPLRHAHAGQSERGLAALPSSLFRRPFRLFLPLLPVIVVTSVLAYNGWIEVHPSALPFEPSVWGQIAKGFRMFYVLEWRPFGFDDDVMGAFMAPMWPQAWTLPCEFRGSLVVFVCCAMLLRVAPWRRMVLVFALAVSFLYQPTLHMGFWDLFLFLNGMILADWRLWREARSSAQARVALPEGDESLAERQRTPHRRFARAWVVIRPWLPTVLASLVLLFSAWLGGLPQSPAGFPGFGYDSVYLEWWSYAPGTIDPFRYWMTVAAIGMVGSLEFLPRLQRVFDSPCIAYLGSISYGAYLCQNMFMFTVGRNLRNWLLVRQVNGDFAAVVAVGMNVLITMWLGDLHWRFVDTKCIAFAKWLAGMVGV